MLSRKKPDARPSDRQDAPLDSGHHGSGASYLWPSTLANTISPGSTTLIAIDHRRSLRFSLFFGLAPHGRRRRVLDREPVVDASRPIVRTEPLRHDAFAAERRGVLEDDPAVALEMLVEGDPVADAAQEFGEHCLAAFERLPPEVAPSASISKAHRTAASSRSR